MVTAACGVREQTAAPAPAPPSLEANAPAQPDTTQPVASGNTPAAADVAAAAGLRAGFDPARDPVKDLETAMVEAARGGKRILLEVGDAQCDRCEALDTLLEGDAPLRQKRDAGYIWVKVNQDSRNPNTDFLAKYPPAQSRPHLYVLDAAGKMLHSQPLEADGDSDPAQDREWMLQWLQQWSPEPPESSDQD
jgi:hypothetical protein